MTDTDGFGVVDPRNVPTDSRPVIRIIVTVHRWIAETGGRSTGTDLE
jgi:hypothetical protein